MFQFIFDRFHTPIAILRGWPESKLVQRHIHLLSMLKVLRIGVLFLMLAITLDLLSICSTFNARPTPTQVGILFQHAAFAVFYSALLVILLFQIGSARRAVAVLSVVPDQDRVLYLHMEKLCSQCDYARLYWTVLQQNARQLRQFDLDKITQITTDAAVIVSARAQ